MAVDLSLLKATVDQSLALSGTAAENTANAAAQAATAEGNTTEAGLYGNAIDIANQNAQFERMAGGIVGIQEARKIAATVGAGQAVAAHNGYSGNSLSSVLMLQESARQGAVAQQTNQLQTDINIGGFIEQAQASATEKAAAEAAAQSASTLSANYAQAAATATANSSAETAALEQLLSNKAINGNLTPQQQAEQDLVTSTLRSPLNGPATLPATSNPNDNTGLTVGSLGTSQAETPASPFAIGGGFGSGGIFQESDPTSISGRLAGNPTAGVA
jgi:hypothetical protein